MRLGSGSTTSQTALTMKGKRVISNEHPFQTVKRPRRQPYTILVPRVTGVVVATHLQDVQVRTDNGELVTKNKRYWSLLP